MRSFSFAWCNLVRRPARTILGILGVATIGALLFDMLLLSRGLVVSFEKLLDKTEFDVRVLATESMALAGPKIPNASAAVTLIAGLPEVDLVVPIRVGRARISSTESKALAVTFVGAVPAASTGWEVVDGNDLHDTDGDLVPVILVNQNLATKLSISPGEMLTLQGSCLERSSPLPTADFRVAGIARFPFDGTSELTAMANLRDFTVACGEEDRDEADVLLIASRPELGADAATRAIRLLLPGMHTFTNGELLLRFEKVGFTYFRQISTVLATITLFFGFLLITMLLTISVNQRLTEIAVERALGFSRRRITIDLLYESSLIVGLGGLLALPLGLGLARGLDAILRAMPGIPGNLHFFVLQPRAVVLHVVLLTITTALASLYPVWLAARLPIMATLRNEVVS